MARKLFEAVPPDADRNVTPFGFLHNQANVTVPSLHSDHGITIAYAAVCTSTMSDALAVEGLQICAENMFATHMRMSFQEMDTTRTELQGDGSVQRAKAATNGACERNFGWLAYLKSRGGELTFVRVEALTMYKYNRVGEWIRSLDCAVMDSMIHAQTQYSQLNFEASREQVHACDVYRREQHRLAFEKKFALQEEARKRHAHLPDGMLRMWQSSEVQQQLTTCRPNASERRQMLENLYQHLKYWCGVGKALKEGTKFTMPARKGFKSNLESRIDEMEQLLGNRNVMGMYTDGKNAGARPCINTDTNSMHQAASQYYAMPQDVVTRACEAGTLVSEQSSLTSRSKKRRLDHLEEDAGAV